METGAQRVTANDWTKLQTIVEGGRPGCKCPGYVLCMHPWVCVQRYEHKNCRTMTKMYAEKCNMHEHINRIEEAEFLPATFVIKFFFVRYIAI